MTNQITGRVRLLRETLWAAAVTKTNPVGRVPAGAVGTVVQTRFGLAVEFDQIPPQSGRVFRIGESWGLFAPAKE